MINIKDYPEFEFLMLGIMDNYSDFSDGINSFIKLISEKEQTALKNEILRLKKYETWEIQTFMARNHLGRPKQKEIPVMLKTILEVLENNMV